MEYLPLPSTWKFKKRDPVVFVRGVFDDGSVRDFPMNTSYFNVNPAVRNPQHCRLGSPFDYAAVRTTHKMQGSEAARGVILLQDGQWMQRDRVSGDVTEASRKLFRRWQYTALTRCARDAYIMRGKFATPFCIADLERSKLIASACWEHKIGFPYSREYLRTRYRELNKDEGVDTFALDAAHAILAKDLEDAA